VKKQNIALIGVMLLSYYASAQHPPDTMWTNIYVDGYESYGCSVQQTTDGGFIATGYTVQSGSLFGDVYLVKTDARGDTLWTRAIGGNSDDYGDEVKLTDDGGYIVVGVTDPPGVMYGDIYLIKTDANGDTLWTRSYGEPENSDFGSSVAQTLDGGYIVAGNVNPDNNTCYIHLMKTDADGDTIWTKTFTDSEGQGNSVIQLQDGNYIITGIVWPLCEGKVFLMKIDENGDTLWNRTYGGDAPLSDDSGNSVQQTQDGGFIIAGSTVSYGAGANDVYLIKTDSEGDTLWTKTYGGYYNEYGRSVDQTYDGGYIITGYTQSFSTVMWYDLYLIRTDSLGDTLWTCTFGDSGIGDVDMGRSVQQTEDGGFIVAGSTRSYTPDTSNRLWLLRLRWDGVLVGDIGLIQPQEFTLYPAYPNPFNSKTRLVFSLPMPINVILNVYDINGREVVKLADGYRSAGEYEAVFDGSGLASGIYFTRFTAGNFSQTRKMLLVK